MSSNYNQTNGYVPGGDYTQGINDYSSFPEFDGTYVAPQNNDNAAAATTPHNEPWHASYNLPPSNQYTLASTARQQQPQQQQQQQQQFGWNTNGINSHFSTVDGRFQGGHALSNAPQSNNFYTTAFNQSGDFHAQQQQHQYYNHAAQATHHNAYPVQQYAFQQSASSSSQPGTIAPQALQNTQNPLARAVKTSTSRESSPRAGGENGDDQHMHRRLPPGTLSGNFSVATIEDLEPPSKLRKLNSFVHIGTVPSNVSISAAAIPTYVPRKSRSEIMQLLDANSNLKAKIDKKLSKKLLKQASKKPLAPRASEEITILGKTGSKQTGSGSASEDSSDDNTSSDESEEDSMQAPLPPKRPSDSAIGAVKYDTIKTLWRVPYRSVPADDIRSTMQAYADIVTTIHNRWKSDVTAVKTAEDSKKVNDLPTLKERTTSQRNLLETSLKAAVQHGHKDFFEHFRQHLVLMGNLAVFLRDRAVESDNTGTLTKALLEFVARCKSMTKGDLEKSQMTKLLTRFAKRGDDTVKGLCKRINENAVAAIKNRDKSADQVIAATTTAKSAKESLKDQTPASPVSSAKRPREGDVEAKPPLKKVASDKPGVRTASDSKAGVVKNPASVKSTTTTTTKAAVRTPSIFASLQPANRRVVPAAAVSQAKSATQSKPLPDRSSAAAAAAAAPQVASQPAQSQSHFSMFFDTLTKPKEPEKAPEKEKKPIDPNETPEEKARRLRRARRGKLNVSFKPDGELEDIRYFTHDPDEELGHDASQVRDVGDLESEGRMFKQLAHEMDIDEDDEEEFEPEKVWVEPSLIDFGEMPEESLMGNYAKYGGGSLQPKSEERITQQEREENTLVEMYSSRSDVPPSPKEPPEVIEEFVAPRTFGAPDGNTKAALLRHELQSKTAGMPDISALLNAVTQVPQQQPKQSQPSQTPTNLTDLLASLGSLAPQAQFQTTGGVQNQQMQYPYPQQQQPPQFTWPQPTQPTQTPQAAPDISAILASLQGGKTSQPAPFGFPTTFPPQQQQQQQHHHQHQQQQEEGGKPEYEERKRRVPSTQQTRYERPMFVLPCRYFQEGKCLKGAACTYRHDME